MMTKRLNNPNHYTITTSREKNVRATKKTKGKKKTLQWTYSDY